MNTRFALIALIVVITFYAGCKKEKKPVINTASTDTSQTTLVDSLVGCYLVSGNTGVWSAYHNNDTTIVTANDTVCILQSSDSSIIVSSIGTGCPIAFDLNTSDSITYCFDISTTWCGPDNSYTVRFYKSNLDSIYIYMKQGGEGSGNITTLVGRKIH